MGNAAIIRFAGELAKLWDQRRAACFCRLVVGLVRGQRLGVAAIARKLPADTVDKHKIKAVDRFLGNKAVDLTVLWASLLGLAAQSRRELLVQLDWTDLDDAHEVLVATVCFGGRALPVAWATSRKGLYERSRNALETSLCLVSQRAVPDGVKLIIVADRGFCRASFFRALRRMGIHFIIRIRRDVHLITERGRGPVSNRAIRRGQARDLPRARYGEDTRVPVRCVIAWGEGDGNNQPKCPWYLVTDLPSEDKSALLIVAGYKRRMRIEHNFRDHKSYRFGFQLHAVQLTKPDRYDRLLDIATVAMMLLVNLGAAVEHRGLHRGFKANTDPARTHSLFQLGLAFLDRAVFDKPRRRILYCCFEAALAGMA